MVKYDHITSASNGQTKKTEITPSAFARWFKHRNMVLMWITASVTFIYSMTAAFDQTGLSLVIFGTFTLALVVACALFMRFDTDELEENSIALEKEHIRLANDAAMRRGLHVAVRRGTVYVIQDIDVTGYCKIGKTNKPADRIGHFDTMLPFNVNVLHIMPSKDCTALETMLHRRFADKRVRGEWFKLTADDIAWIKQIEAA